MAHNPAPESRALLYCAGGGIGDSLVASVIARALHKHYAIVDALTLPGHRDTLERVPDIDRVLVDEGEERDVAAMLAGRRYDACIVSWATARTAHVPQLAKISIRVGQARRLYSWRFTNRITVRSELGNVTSHWSDIVLDYARGIGCDTDNHIPKFVPTPEDKREAEEVAKRIGTDFIILHPTNAVAPQSGIWPTEGWAALASALATRYGVRVVVTGTKADTEITRAICGRSGALDLCGATGIGGFGALAQRAKAFVGITTGSMHIAAAVGAPTLGIFPFQSDFPERWAPLGAHTAVVRPSYPCHPGDTKERCPDYACIANLNIPQIMAALDGLLVSSGQRSLKIGD